MKNLKLLFALSLIAPLLPAQKAKPAEAPVHIRTAQELDGAVKRVDQLFTSEYAKDKLGSVTVGIVSGPKLVWTKSYGLADIEKGTPATGDSIYRIGSITKQFTAIMLLQLAEQGKIHLSDPVEKYYPEIRKANNSYSSAPPVTLLQLATHTSGLEREPEDRGTYVTGQVADWEKTLLAALQRTKFAFEPGTRYSYSNIGYAILGAALGRAAGEPYIHYVQEHILGPLGMAHTAYEQNPEILQMLAKGYTLRNAAPDPKPAERDLNDGRGYKIPNGAVFTTIGDMARFMSFEMGDGPESVLKKATLADNRKRVYSANSDLSFGYGIGFMLYRKGSQLAVGHSGAVAGYMAGAYFDPVSHTGMIYLRSGTGPGFRNELMLATMDLLAK